MTGKEIRELREELGLTQPELADRLGVHQVTISRWETDNKHPSNLAKRQLAKLKEEVQNNGNTFTNQSKRRR